MDPTLATAAQALARGDALGVLRHVALREDAPALAMQGIAMAQLGDHPRARGLLQRAIRRFGPRARAARARCVLALEEVALAMRDLDRPDQVLDRAIEVLDAGGDSLNATHGRVIQVRRLLLLGRLADARATLARLDGCLLPPALAARASLSAAELALRAIRCVPAREALGRAAAAAPRAGIASLAAAVEAVRSRLRQPVARRGADATGQPLHLAEVEALFASGLLVVDACRLRVRVADAWLPLARRPVLFALAHALAAAWPADASRAALIAAAFGLRGIDDTHRARLRVEIGRLRTLLAPWAALHATRAGYALRPHDGRGVAVLLPPADGPASPLVAVLGPGRAWSTAGEGQDMADMAEAGTLDLSVFEHVCYPLERINEAISGIASRNGGFSNFVINP